jgi:tetratricopeptide (TPR) repeat protein
VLPVEELHRRALTASAEGRQAAARNLLVRALGRKPTTEMRARILLSLAYQESERGRLEDGLRLLKEAAQQPGLGDPLLGLLVCQRALLLMRSGDWAGALASYDRALPLLGHDDPRELARAALNRSNVHLRLGELERARADCELCIEIARDHDLKVLGAHAVHNLGYLDMLSGDLPLALQRMDDVRPVFDALSPESKAVADADRAEVMMRAGMFSLADKSLAKAAAAFGSRRLRQSQAEAELTRARLALASQKLREAIRLARRARTRFAHRGAEAWMLQCDLVVLAARVRRDRSLQSVVSEGTSLAAELRKRCLTDDALTASLWVASALTRLGELDRARSLLGRCRVRERSPITTRLLSNTVRSELALALRERRAAGVAVRRGLMELHTWQSSFGSLDLQTGVVAHGRELARMGLRLAVADGRPAAVFDWSERARAFASRIAPVRPPADPAAESALAELRQLRIEIREDELSGTADDAVKRRSAQLEDRIRSRGSIHRVRAW